MSVKLIWGCDRCGVEVTTCPPDDDWREKPKGWRYDDWRSEPDGRRKLLCCACVAEIVACIDATPSRANKSA